MATSKVRESKMVQLKTVRYQCRHDANLIGLEDLEMIKKNAKHRP